MNTTLALAVITALMICLIQDSSAQDDVTATSEPISNMRDPDAREGVRNILDTVKKTKEENNVGYYATDNYIKGTTDTTATNVVPRDEQDEVSPRIKRGQKCVRWTYWGECVEWKIKLPKIKFPFKLRRPKWG